MMDAGRRLTSEVDAEFHDAGECVSSKWNRFLEFLEEGVNGCAMES